MSESALPASSKGPAARPPTADEREKLSLLREAFSHAQSVLDHQSAWWERLALADRRLLVALAGLDDSEEFARRNWRQISQEHRDAVFLECRRVGRLLRPITR